MTKIVRFIFSAKFSFYTHTLFDDLIEFMDIEHVLPSCRNFVFSFYLIIAVQ